MGKYERAKKQVKRLQLRREVIRVLASDSLAWVAGGIGIRCEDTEGTCPMSLKPTDP